MKFIVVLALALGLSAPAQASTPAVFRPRCDSHHLAKLYVYKSDASASNPYRLIIDTRQGQHYSIGHDQPSGSLEFLHHDYPVHAVLYNSTFGRQRFFTAGDFCS